MILVRLVVGPLQVNCYILADEKTKDAVIIDPGDDADEILRVVREKGLKVRYLVNTHAHFDHVGANKKIKEETGAQLLLHEKDAVVLKNSISHAAVFNLTTTASPEADRYIQHGDVITAGEISLRVMHTPGHSPGGISLVEHGMVFTGDALFAGSVGRADLPGGDLMMLIKAIKTHLLTLPDETRVFPGHGPDTTIGDERRDNPFLNSESGFV